MKIHLITLTVAAALLSSLGAAEPIPDKDAPVLKQSEAAEVKSDKKKKPKKAKTYLVMYRKEIFINGKTKNGETLEQLVQRHCREFAATEPTFIYKHLKGFAADFTADGMKDLKKQPEVEYMEKDQEVRAY